MFMMMEITMQGVFYGLGRTIPPAIVSIGCNYMRIPLKKTTALTNFRKRNMVIIYINLQY